MGIKHQKAAYTPRAFVLFVAGQCRLKSPISSVRDGRNVNQALPSLQRVRDRQIYKVYGHHTVIYLELDYVYPHMLNSVLGLCSGCLDRPLPPLHVQWRRGVRISLHHLAVWPNF